MYIVSYTVLRGIEKELELNIADWRPRDGRLDIEHGGWGMGPELAYGISLSRDYCRDISDNIFEMGDYGWLILD